MAAMVPPPVRHVVRVLAEAGHQAVVVGGAVRDLVRGEVPGDFDVATSATPDEVTARFPHTVPTGMAHGTVTVVAHADDGTPLPVEVTTFRTEGGYRDGRRPDAVSFVRALEDDLSRRDFTINAIALHLWPAPRLADPFGGVQDLAAGVLRTVGSADVRFGEDGLRALRAARFLAQLELTAADGLEDAVARALPVVRKVSVERFHQELDKLFRKSACPSRALGMIARTGLMEVLAPGAPADAESHARVDRVDRRAVEVRWAAWLWSLGGPAARARVAALRGSKALQDDVGALCALPRPDALGGASAAVLRRTVRAVGRRRKGAAVALWVAEGGGALAERVEAVLTEGFVETAAELALDGNALAALTGATGKQLGQLIRTLLDQVDEDPAVNTAVRLGELARAVAARGRS